MDAEEQWCLSWLGTYNVKLDLNDEFLEEFLTQKNAYLNQRTADKGKGITTDDDARKEAYVGGNGDSSNDDDGENNDVAEATRRSLFENYVVEGEPSRVATRRSLFASPLLKFMVMLMFDLVLKLLIWLSINNV